VARGAVLGGRARAGPGQARARVYGTGYFTVGWHGNAHRLDVARALCLKGLRQRVIRLRAFDCMLLLCCSRLRTHEKGCSRKTS
jgi:hypothetical protein